MDLNEMRLIGNVARDPEQRKLPSGVSVTKVVVATNHSWKDSQTSEKKTKTDFHNLIGWNHLADIMAKYLKKGDRVYFSGRLENQQWQGKDGQKKFATRIIARDMIMLGKPKQTDIEKAQKAEIIEEDITGENPF